MTEAEELRKLETELANLKTWYVREKSELRARYQAEKEETRRRKDYYMRRIGYARAYGWYKRELAELRCSYYRREAELRGKIKELKTKLRLLEIARARAERYINKWNSYIRKIEKATEMGEWSKARRYYYRLKKSLTKYKTLIRQVREDEVRVIETKFMAIEEALKARAVI